jgi:hypothetical protein
MALSAKSLFLYGFQVTELNRSIDFKAVSGGPEIQATLTIGYYSLTSLATEIKRAMQAADPLRTYTVSVNRNISGGTENRVTISTSGTFLSLLFGTGTRAASTVAPLIGFTSTDKTGFLTYTGSATAGTAVVSNLIGYNYLSPDFVRKQFGSLNISASGQKEAIVFATQRFWQVQFKYIPSATFVSQWLPLMTWMTMQRLLEFTPEISNPTVFYEGTLESHPAESKGLGYTFTEMLPSFPNNFDSGLMKFRVRETT